VSTVQAEHKKLFEMANQLFEAGKNNKTKEFIADMLKFLDDYTRKHFKDEEAYMQSINYPGLTDQKKLHADFIAALDKLKKEYQESGGSIIVILNANQMVVDWLLKHISIEDKKIGAYANSR